MLSYYQFLDELCKRHHSEMFSILTFVVNRFIRDKNLDFDHMVKFIKEMGYMFNNNKNDSHPIIPLVRRQRRIKRVLRIRRR